MRVAVVGETVLADAIRHCAAPHFTLCDPEHATVVWLASEEIPERVPGSAPVLISSPWPVGTCRRLEETHPGRWFGVAPENIREAHAVEDFRCQARIVLGLRHWKDSARFSPLLAPFTDDIVVMGVESAEMTKHAINSFLAVEITFANELAAICERVGAKPDEVVKGLMSDPRVGDGYLRPGGPAGGHLMRDVRTLQGLGAGPLLSCL